MVFAVNDYNDLIRLLKEHPEWQVELRHLLLSEDFLALPEIVRSLATAQQRTEQRLEELAEAQQRTEQRLEELAEAQQRTEQRLEELAEAQQRTEQRLEELAEAQQRTEQRLEELAAAQQRTEQRLEELAEAQQRTEQRLEELAAAQQRTEQRLEELAAAQQRTEQRLETLVVSHDRLATTVGNLKGKMLELTYSDKAGAYLGRLLRRVKVVPAHTLEDTLETHLSPTEFDEVLLLDLLVRGMPRYHPELPEVWLALEISSVVDRNDVRRVLKRTQLLRQAGYQAIPVVAGEEITQGAEEETSRESVVVLQDGQILLWAEALQAWVSG
jgi:chemotaxis protein histidine kinase CheA